MLMGQASFTVSELRLTGNDQALGKPVTLWLHPERVGLCDGHHVLVRRGWAQAAGHLGAEDFARRSHISGVDSGRKGAACALLAARTLARAAGARGQVVEADQIDVVAFAVFGDFEEVEQAGET